MAGRKCSDEEDQRRDLGYENRADAAHDEQFSQTIGCHADPSSFLTGDDDERTTDSKTNRNPRHPNQHYAPQKAPLL